MAYVVPLCGVIFRSVPLQTTENWDMLSHQQPQQSDEKYPYLNPNNLKRGGTGDSKFMWELQETWFYISKVRNPWDGEGQAPFGPKMCENSLNWTEKH